MSDIIDLKFNSSGTDAKYLANANMFFGALFDTSIFKSAWPEDKLGSRSVLENRVDWYRQMFEGGLTGNRNQIAARKTARSDLDLHIQKILYYVAVMGDQSDISQLLNSNAVYQKSKKRARRTVKPAAANS